MTLPSGTVTFLFTDLEGSTRLWEDHPDAMHHALARHDGLLRSAVTAEEGIVVKNTGDGVHAVFARADRALAAAVAAQRAIDAEPWAETGPLRVRVGLHTGVAEFRDDDYYGPALNRAARLTAAAHGGQVVVSHATEELIRDELPPGVALVDLGEHRLRDLLRPERVFQVVVDGLRAQFPPLRALAAARGNIPAQLTSFVDRQSDTRVLQDALKRARMVTVTGVGGVGKTRLALELCSSQAANWPDGAWFCDLAAAGTADAVVEVVGATLAVPPRPAASLAESVVEHLRDRSLLLLLDNCEHQLDAVAGLASAILRSCANVRIVATSRERCSIEGEQVLPLAALPTPDASIAPDTLTANDSVRLFCDRARTVRAEFAVVDSNAGAVGEICRHLDGLPLALELAAARAASMTPTEIAAGLEQRFRLLSAPARDRAPHQRTLRAAVDWSYALLDDREREVLARLGVFAGTFDARAAQAVASADAIGEWDVFEAVAGLVSKSMLVDEQTREGATRYRMLETIREYARELLDQQGTTNTWCARHADYYASLAEELGPQLLGADELAVQARVHAALDDFRAAVAWSFAADDAAAHEFGLRIVAALGVETGYNRAFGIGDWAERALAFVDHSPSRARRTAVLAAAAWAAYYKSDIARMGELSAEAVRDGLPPDTPAAFMSYFVLAGAFALLGRRSEMLDTIGEGRGALDEIGAGDVHQAFVSAAEALWSCVVGDLDTAAAPAREALTRARALGNPTLLAVTLYAFGRSSWLAQPDVALAALDESVDLVRAGAADTLLGPALCLTATIHSDRDDAVHALTDLRDAIVHDARLGDRVQVRTALERGVEVLVNVGCPTEAAVLHGAVSGDVVIRRFMSGPERARHDASAARAEAELGAPGFERAAAEGAGMELDDLVAWSVAALDHLLGDAR